MSYAAIYFGAAFGGAILGGLISMLVSAYSARRDRRVRYGEALLEVLVAAQQRVRAAVEDDDGRHREPDAERRPLRLHDEAARLWATTELAASLARGRRDRSAMQAWGLRLYNTLSTGVADPQALDDLELDLDRGVYLVIAWSSGVAAGRDFARPADEVDRYFGPRLDE